MAKRSLNGEWALAWCRPGEGESEGWPQGGVPAGRALRATVPGDVHVDLLEAGLIDEPLYARNAPDCAWMEEMDWWYSRRFHAPDAADPDRAELVFNGLDTTADVYLNGVAVGQSNNAHVPHRFDVTDALRPGENLLVVRLDCGLRQTEDRELAKYQMHGGEPPERRMWVRKAQFTFEWDWAPRLVTCGIWRDVEMCLHRRAALRDVCLRSDVRPDGSALVEVLAEIENPSEEPVEASLRVALTRAETHELMLTQSVEPGRQTLRGEIELPDPDLWWPAPLGEPALYDVSAELTVEGQQVDARQLRCGIRQVELIQEPLGEEGTSFIIAVNGRRVFCKGANWVPPDSLPARITPARYQALVEAAAEANFNMLRIWGGGTFEDDAFYDACDERGILVWHDFMFACSYYPDEDEQFVAECRTEAERAVRRLRSRACIALWCGNNENQWIHYQRRQAGEGAERCYGGRLYDEVLPEVCARLDPTRPYWPSSPYGGRDPNSQFEGDSHGWRVSILAPTLEQRIDYSLYAEDCSKFMSEFGILSPPNRESMERYLPPGELRDDSESWAFHNNKFEKGTLREALARYWRPAGELSLDEYIRFGQMIQAEALKFAVEHWRRRKFDTAGALFWMFADCWGEVGWTVIDYYLNRKASYWAVKRAFAPVLVSLALGERGVEIWLLNDLPRDAAGRLTTGWVDLDEGRVEQEVATALAPANASAQIRILAPPTDEPARWVPFARFETEDGRVSTNRQFLTGFHFNRLHLAPARVECELDAEAGELRLRTDRFAWQVWLDLPRGVRPSDNAFDMLPGEERVLDLCGPRELYRRITARPLNRAD